MKKGKVIGKIISVICSIGLFFVIIATMFLSTSKTLVTKENLSSYIKKTDVLNIDVNTLFNLKEESGLTLKEKITSMALELSIPEEIVTDILKSEELNDLLGEFFNQTIYYALNGGDKPQVSQDTTDKMSNVANASLENHINIIMEPEDLEILIEKYSEGLTNLVPDRNQMIGEFPIDKIRSIMNFNTIYFYITIVILTVFIGLFTRSVHKPIKYIGIPMLISGIVFVIFGCMDNFISTLVTQQTNHFNAFISPLVISVLTLWFKCGVLVSFSGLFLIIIYLVINRIIINGYKAKKLEETRRINIEDIHIK